MSQVLLVLLLTLWRLLATAKTWNTRRRKDVDAMVGSRADGENGEGRAMPLPQRRRRRWLRGRLPWLLSGCGVLSAAGIKCVIGVSGWGKGRGRPLPRPPCNVRRGDVHTSSITKLHHPRLYHSVVGCLDQSIRTKPPLEFSCVRLATLSYIVPSCFQERQGRSLCVDLDIDRPDSATVWYPYSNTVPSCFQERSATHWLVDLLIKGKSASPFSLVFS